MIGYRIQKQLRDSCNCEKEISSKLFELKKEIELLETEQDQILSHKELTSKSTSLVEATTISQASSFSS
ncbi:hypothetical protein TSUD_111740 [Trifolium subterraneum]|uniref:Uncharacterized protein n=1 Tax=Trifolium subterraneum TaxID=3900 RepID=A0A2Z6NX00_TRISU|nr:hypothetical protein TSUD_111740 [Trifolium subterraneum]